MTLLEAEPRVESQDNGETAYQTAKEVLKKYPEVRASSAPPPSMRPAPLAPSMSWV